MFVRVPISVDGPYAPAPIPGLVRANYPAHVRTLSGSRFRSGGGLAVIPAGVTGRDIQPACRRIRLMAGDFRAAARLRLR
jgi:hypothetical protein